MPKNVYKNKKTCQKCGDSNHIEGFQCTSKKFQCRSCHNYGHFTSLCYQKKQASFKPRKPKAHMLQVGVVYACDKSICGRRLYPEDCTSSDESFWLQVKMQQSQAEGKKIPTPSHLITNLAYKLKQHQTRNQYLRARLDTCADVNIMQDINKLVFNDPEVKKLAPSNLDIGTYTTNTVKIEGSCLFIWSTQTLKKLQEVTFYVAKMMVVSCYPALQHLCFGLKQLHTRLDYLPPRSSWITSPLDNSRKTKRVSVHGSRKEMSVQSTNQAVTVSHAKQLVPKFVTSKRADFTKLPRCFWGYWMLPRSPLPYWVRSHYYPQADSLQTNPIALERSFSSRNWQDGQSRSSKASIWGHPHGPTVLCLLRGRTGLAI